MDIDIAGQLLPAFAGVGVALGAFAVILWLIKNRKSRIFALPGSGSQKRLAVVESVALDVRRRLVLIRRDNVEHLIMVGGPADLVIETRDMNAGSGMETRRANAAPAQATMPEPVQQTARRPAAQQPRAEAPQNRQASRQREDDYAYGPEAAALNRDYQTEERYESRRGGYAPNPAQQFFEDQPAEADLEAQLKQEAAETILEAARKRLLGESPVEPAPQASRTAAQPQPRPHQSRAPTTAANMRESAFSRVLDGRTQDGDIPASQTPQVRPARAWSPPPVAAERPAATQSAASAAARRAQVQQSDDELEEKVRMILGEMQRKQQ